MNQPIENFPVYLYFLIALILLMQSTWMFIDARKHGHNHWLWGILGLIHFPMYLLIYLIFARKIFRKKKER